MGVGVVYPARVTASRVVAFKPRESKVGVVTRAALAHAREQDQKGVPDGSLVLENRTECAVMSGAMTHK